MSSLCDFIKQKLCNPVNVGVCHQVAYNDNGIWTKEVLNIDSPPDSINVDVEFEQLGEGTIVGHNLFLGTHCDNCTLDCSIYDGTYNVPFLEYIYDTYYGGLIGLRYRLSLVVIPNLFSASSYITGIRAIDGSIFIEIILYKCAYNFGTFYDYRQDFSSTLYYGNWVSGFADIRIVSPLCHNIYDYVGTLNDEGFKTQTQYVFPATQRFIFGEENTFNAYENFGISGCRGKRSIIIG